MSPSGEVHWASPVYKINKIQLTTVKPSLQELAIDRITHLVNHASTVTDEDLRQFILAEGRELAEAMDQEDFFFYATYHRFS